jgi:hypothetical protein
MKANLRLNNVFVDDVSRFSVKKGEPFSLSLYDFPEGTVMDWFSNNDPVLTIRVTGNDADLTANEVGACQIHIMSDASILKTIFISVLDEIEPMAVTLGISVGEPELK